MDLENIELTLIVTEVTGEQFYEFGARTHPCIITTSGMDDADILLEPLKSPISVETGSNNNPDFDS